MNDSSVLIIVRFSSDQTDIMYCKLAFATLAVIIGSGFVSAQKIPSETTAAELWNPWTWFWPYAIASAEAYRDYYEKAQKATNELYQQIYKTNAFPLITGNWNTSQNNQGGNTGGQSNQTESGAPPGQEGSTLPNEGENPGNSPQQNQESNNEQTNQEESTLANEKGNDEEKENNEENSVANEGSGVQAQGNVQDDGTADVEANAGVKEKN